MNYAVVEEGLVSNVIWLNDSNADEFPNAVPLGDVPAGIGDTYDGAHFYRDEPCWNRRKRKRRTCARRSCCWA